MAGGDELEAEEWPVEDIPNDDWLFLRVKHCHVENGEPMAGAFRNHGSGDDLGMSTDWDKYSTPNETRDRAAEPSLFGVMAMRVVDVRGIPSQIVVHAPIWPDNRAHANVKGPKGSKETTRVDSVEIRLRFRQVSEWRIRLGQGSD